jgi:hypothetical protein
VAPVKPPEPIIPETQEELLREIGLLLDAVDMKVDKRDWQVTFSHYSTFRDEGDRLATLVDAFNNLADPDNLLDEPPSSAAIREAFGATPGTVPSWARPGRFLLWVGYVPCLCVWGGFAEPEGYIAAADPDVRWMAPSGRLNASRTIPTGYANPQELYRSILLASTTARQFSNGRKPGGPAFNLHRLDDDVKRELREDLAKPENAWLVEALRRGPVNQLALPAHLQAVQITWFD